jgi:Xaa-Pro aminopeptidase
MQMDMMVPGGSEDLALRAFAVLALEEEPALVLNSGFVANAATSWIDSVYAYGMRALPAQPPGSLDSRYELLLRAVRNAYEGLLDALDAALRDRGLAEASIGLDERGLPADLISKIQERLPRARILRASNLFKLLRMVKTPPEVERLRHAAATAESAAHRAFASAAPGASMRHLARIFRERVARDGADFDHFAYGVRGLSLATVPDYRLKDDDCFSVDFGCIYDGYYSDSAATVALKPLPVRLLRAYEALAAAIDEGVLAARVGVPASAVHAAMADVLAEAGVAGESLTGHGLGIEIRDLPVIVPANGLRVRDDLVDLPSDIPLEADMVMNLEVSYFEPGVASLEVERTVHVTEAGTVYLLPDVRRTPFVVA